MRQSHSIQQELKKWIMVSAMLLVSIAAIVSGVIAFFEARGFQDELLKEIALLVQTGRVASSEPINPEGLEEESIVIWPLDNTESRILLAIPPKTPSGFQTREVSGSQWRILIFTQPDSEQRVAVGQQTELRNQAALASAVNAVLPMLFLMLTLLGVVHVLIQRKLRPLIVLANHLNSKKESLADPLSLESIPSEIIPFVTSINSLLKRINYVVHRQQRFIADAAHELRTPVTALSLMAENVSNATSESEKLGRYRLLRQGLDRLNDLVNQLLDLARLQSDVPGVLESSSLNRIVRDAIAELYPIAESRRIDIGIKYEVSLCVSNQRNTLGQLVRNAIENAINHSPVGAYVDIKLVQEDGNAIFVVEDSGAGIPENELERVMTPFYRAKVNETQGVGLGLAICQEIAYRLGGKILLRNRSGGGLIFQYSQPVIRNE